MLRDPSPLQACMPSRGICAIHSPAINIKDVIVVTENKAQDQTVTATAQVVQTSVGIRFLPVIGGGEKSPICRALMALPGPLSGLSLEFPVFKKDGSYSVALPGGRFASMKAAHQVNAAGEMLLDVEVAGSIKLANLPSKILTAYHAFTQTNQPLQHVAL